MIIDSYALVKQPGEMTMIEKEKYSTSILTYTDVAYFSWGLSIIGKEIKMRWGGMSTTQFDALQTKFELDTPVVFDPEQGDGKTYNVEIKEFRGTYHLSLLDSASFRTKCEMDLLILSEV